ncbi:uncharacterized protein TNCV_2151671 [Trichonephila clavipes]|uniref:Retrotransposon gag domain-containing protein n=1 Tax=Trichonephila clavipes TaxID=2585209 RepID=A0A8X6R7Y0_TRICX|nr:uncharacterized protein TNCV_2151671 [Trichonephila clavipes]
MAASSSSVIPTPLADADNEEGHAYIGAQRNLIYMTPSDLSCAYSKSHLLERAQDWYQIFGPALVQNAATDFAQLKATLSNAFPAMHNKKNLEIKFYASQQRRDQEPTNFAYDLLKLNKKLELGMPEEALVDHIFVRLEPQVQEWSETTDQLCGGSKSTKHVPTVRGHI